MVVLYLNHMYSMIALCDASKELSPLEVVGGLFGNSIISSSVHALFSLNSRAKCSIMSIDASLRVLTGAVTNWYRSRSGNLMCSILSAICCFDHRC